MSVNTMSFEDASQVLNDIKTMVTGEESIAPVNTGEFVSVAQTTLLAGLDPVMNAITQVLGRTIISERPYKRKFQGLQVDSMRFGAIMRKLSFVDLPMEPSKQWDLEDGTSVDMFTIRKQPVLQTNIYGSVDYQYHRTVTRSQLYNAFRTPEEFADFMSGLATNFSNTIEQNRELHSRITLANHIAGRIAGANEDTPIAEESVVHLISEYNAATGGSYDFVSIKAPDVFPAFSKWAFARIEKIRKLMTERSQIFQTDVEGKPVNRHTDTDLQRIFILNENLDELTSRVLADTYHENMLNGSITEGVNFWQSIKKTDEIQAKPTFMLPDGTLKTPDEPVIAEHVFGTIMDRDASAITFEDEETAPTPYDTAGRYWNIWHTGVFKWVNDFTEKSVVLLLD